MAVKNLFGKFPDKPQGEEIPRPQPVQQGLGSQPVLQSKTPLQQPVPKVNPASSTSGMDYLSQMYTSPEQEERYRRSSVANQRIAALGDALRHIGNIYHTVNYAPSQQFNSPVQEEYQRYQQARAIRDNANMRYLTYQQQRDQQDRLMRKNEADNLYKQASLALRQNQLEKQLRDQDLAVRKQEALERINQEKLELDRAYKSGLISKGWYDAQTRRMNAESNRIRADKYTGGGGGVSGYTTVHKRKVTKYGEDGTPVEWEDTTERTGNMKELPTYEQKELP